MVDQGKNTGKRTISFYKNFFSSFIFMLTLVIFILVGVVFFILYQVFNRPLPEFKAVSPDNQQLALTSFFEPNLLPSTLLKWASKAAVASYTFDFVNFPQQIAGVRKYFTPSGWSDYQASLYNLLQDIAQKQIFVNGVVYGAPVISNQGFLPGRGYVWRVQLPFLVTYQSSEKTSRQGYYLTMTIVKVSTLVDTAGIGIDEFIMR